MPRPTKKIHMGPVEFEPYRPKKGEAYMNTTQRSHFKKILIDWKRRLMEEIDSTMQNMQNEPENYADLIDSASQETTVNLEIKKRDRERKLLNKIDKSLNQIDLEDYGYCEDCGTEIGIKRLEARPTANLCIDCKTLQEIKEKQE